MRSDRPMTILPHRLTRREMLAAGVVPILAAGATVADAAPGPAPAGAIDPRPMRFAIDGACWEFDPAARSIRLVPRWELVPAGVPRPTPIATQVLHLDATDTTVV